MLIGSPQTIPYKMPCGVVSYMCAARALALAGNTEKAQVLQCYKKKRKEKEKNRNGIVYKRWRGIVYIYIYYVYHVHNNNIYNVYIMG